MIDDQLYTDAVRTLVCTAVIFDLTERQHTGNHAFPIEVMNHLYKLVEHFKPINDGHSTEDMLNTVFAAYEEFKNL